jgi:pyruvate/2-oxoglutarate dehydrogenase complex dihydrolipoamide dehydrogenase (E3) component
VALRVGFRTDAAAPPGLPCRMDPHVQHFDHLLIGTGQATGTLIAGLPEHESIAIVEGGAIGGTCVNAGCTPTKTLVASARVAAFARRGADYGVVTGDVAVDFEAAMARMNGVRHASRDGLTRYLTERPNVTLVRGWARFTEPMTVQVDGRSIRGDRVYLNVGARAVVPPIHGLDTVAWLDNVRVLDLERLPEHLVVIGASYIGLELGQVFRRFGARVTVVEAASRLLGREDEDVADEVRAILEREGLRFEVGVPVERVAADGDGVQVVLANGREIAGSHLLVATGRRPNSDRLDLHLAGVDVDDRGYVLVDDRARTSAEGVFALGDVNGRGAFTHTSVHDAQVVLDLLQGGEGDARSIGERPDVYALFTDPPLGRVGLTEAQALEAGHRVLRAVKPMRAISRAKEMGETQGFVKVLVDADTDRFLGASVLGVGGDEVVNLFALAMSAGLTTAQFRRAVLVHPTVSELMPWVLAGLQPVLRKVAA